ncbi:MAG TPA: BrnT family toxin [Gemmatimonadaceae bacterium]|nr:BrnT family toxin [Gemmatimonadaceae bacterium]
MDWTWDPAKSTWTAQERGFNFAYAARVFEGRVHLVHANRHGERRWQAIGLIDGRYYSVIYTKRGTGASRTRRIISARRARDNEIEAYHNHHAR